jgi:hypothetical protein
MVYQYIISSLFVFAILRILYINIKAYKHGKLKTENIIISILMIKFLFTWYMRD